MPHVFILFKVERSSPDDQPGGGAWAQMTVFGLNIFICDVWGGLCLDVAHTYVCADINIHRSTHVHTSTRSVHLLCKCVVSSQ